MANQPQGGNRTRSRRAPALLLVTAAVVLVGAAIGIWIVNRLLVFTVEDVGPQRSVHIWSRFADFISWDMGHGQVTLLSSVYPGSAQQEEIAKDWYPNSPQQRAQLTVLRFSAVAEMKRVDDWYTKRLGSEFLKTTGWPEGDGHDNSAWAPSVSPKVDPKALWFHQDLDRRARGVVVQLASQGEVEITLYDFQN